MYRLFRPGVIAVSALLVLSSCALQTTMPQPFLQSYIERYDLSAPDLRQIQYYLSREVVLRRDWIESNHDLVQGRLVVRDGVNVDEVVIHQNTPGVLRRVSDGQFLVSFEKGSASLAFKVSQQFENGRVDDSRYHIVGRVMQDQSVKVRYNGKAYNLVGNSYKAVLLVDQDFMPNYTADQKTLRGWRVGQ